MEDCRRCLYRRKQLCPEPARAAQAGMKAFVIATFALLMAGAAFAQTADDVPISRAPVPPKIDGILDDEAWKVAPLPMTFDQWVSYNPVRGDKMPEVFRTEVRITYDDRNIYFA